MSKDIHDLIPDMQLVLSHKMEPRAGSMGSVASLGGRLAAHYTSSLLPREGERTPHRLWFSQLGTQCYRREWYAINHPELSEPLTPSTRFKFLYGNVIEELALGVASAAGHSVEACQERIELPITDEWSVTGRIDAIIDGVVVDVKSMSTYSFNAQTDDIALGRDTFGYRMQLNGYNAVLNEGKPAALLCVDKQLGHMKLAWEYNPMPLVLIKGLATGIIEAVTGPTPPPRRPLVPYGKGGNEALDMYCSYCSYKTHCWGKPRIFLYSGKPVYLAKVVVEPKVPELHYEETEEAI